MYFKINNSWIPVGCLTDNTMSESTEFLDTTTRDNQGWTTSKPIMQSYNLSFAGFQLNTTVAGGNFSVISLDKLKQLKRNRTLLDWKFQGAEYPIVDYGKCYISDLSDPSIAGELITFSGSAIGFGKPLTAPLGTTILNNGNPDVVINTGDVNVFVRTNEL